MFRTDTALVRRVSISHRGGSLCIHIKRHNQWRFFILLLLCFTAVFVFFCSIFLKGLLRIHSASDILYFLPFVLFILVWYGLALRIGLWRGFGVEDLVLENGHLYWERTVWKWHRKFDAALSDISDVQAKTPWHALANRVEFTCRGCRYRIGDMLLKDEANEIAHEVQRAAGLHSRLAR